MYQRGDLASRMLKFWARLLLRLAMNSDENPPTKFQILIFIDLSHLLEEIFAYFYVDD
jgi:hypothetical protein